MPEAVQDPPEDVNSDSPKENLRKMSFGDHLDELRRRLVWCMATLFVCVGVMLPFKSDVTKIYLHPYAIMWAQAYDDWLVKLDKEFEDGMGPTDPKAREAAAEFFTKTTREAILAGGYANPGEIRTLGGYDKPYPPTTDQAAWDAFVLDFTAYSKNVRRQRDRIKQVMWHEGRKEEIIAGEFNEKADLIYSQGGFPLHKNLKSVRPLEDFWTFMAACLLFACIAASPVLLWHMWAFISAGLYKTEKGVVHRALPFALGLLVTGVAFGYFVMVPYAFYFLAKMMDWTLVGPLFTVSDYFKFLLTLTVALGMVFQLPILMVALQKVGILKLATVRKHWRWAVLSFFVISAMLTPPDPVTQALMVTPMLTLFGLGLFLMWSSERKQKRAEAAASSKT